MPAAKMSAWPDRPDDFVAAGHDAGSFAPRRDSGAYLRAILDEAVASGGDAGRGERGVGASATAAGGSRSTTGAA